MDGVTCCSRCDQRLFLESGGSGGEDGSGDNADVGVTVCHAVLVDIITCVLSSGCYWGQYKS